MNLQNTELAKLLYAHSLCSKAFSLRGLISPTDLPTRVSALDPAGARPPDPRYRLAFPRSPCSPIPTTGAPPAVATWRQRCLQRCHKTGFMGVYAGRERKTREGRKYCRGSMKSWVGHGEINTYNVHECHRNDNRSGVSSLLAAALIRYIMIAWLVFSIYLSQFSLLSESNLPHCLMNITIYFPSSPITNLKWRPTYGEPSVDTLGVVLVVARQSPDHLSTAELVEANDTDDDRLRVAVWLCDVVRRQMLNIIRRQSSFFDVTNHIAQSQQLLNNQKSEPALPLCDLCGGIGPPNSWPYFFKIKANQYFLAMSMNEDRLSSLALLSIENAVASELNYSSLSTKFAAIKARRVSF